MKQPAELIQAVRIPLPLAPTVAFHKIAKRRFDDISSVAIAFALEVAGRCRRRGSPSASAGGGHPAAGHRHRGRAARPAMDRRHRTGAPPPCSAREGTPIDDHRASAAFRAAMLEQSPAQVPCRVRNTRGITS